MQLPEIRNKQQTAITGTKNLETITGISPFSAESLAEHARKPDSID